MRRSSVAAMVLALACASAACTTPGANLRGALPQGRDAYAAIPAGEPAVARDYRINPLDVLAVTVFKEPDLTFRELPVDASGSIQFPLIGEVRAAGLTAPQLADVLAVRLNQNYLRRAQVSVLVATSQSRQITVEGGVAAPGVYEIGQGATLLQALALAKSPVQVADTSAVAVFRVVDGRRVGALFDVNQVRRGAAADPQVRGGDTIVVGYSALKSAFRDFLQAAPIIGVFRPY